MSTLEEQTAKAKALYDAEMRSPHSLMSVLHRVASFVDGHSESWYYSGQQLRGQIDAVVAWLPEYIDHVYQCGRAGNEAPSLEKYIRDALTAGRGPRDQKV